MECGEPIAADERAVVTEPLVDAIIAKEGQDTRRFANPAGTGQSNRYEVFDEMNDSVDQPLASEEDLQWWRWRFPLKHVDVMVKSQRTCQ